RHHRRGIRHVDGVGRRRSRAPKGRRPMIRINLLTVDRERRKKRLPAFGTVAQRLTAGCSLILVVAVSFCGWRYWRVSRASNDLDRQITTAQEETTRLHSIIQQVQQF